MPPAEGGPVRRFAAALRALTGRRPRAPDDAAPGPATAAEAPRPATDGDEAAARIDAARERLRASITAPADEE